MITVDESKQNKGATRRHAQSKFIVFGVGGHVLHEWLNPN